MEKLKCEGNCIEDDGEHHGQVLPVIVSGNNYKGVFFFNYCETAVQEDKDRGFKVILESEVLQEFENLLKEHDWWYMMSDDPRIFDTGLAEENTIEKYLLKYPKFKELYEQYKIKNKQITFKN